jgi:hypothetical protein
MEEARRKLQRRKNRNVQLWKRIQEKEKPLKALKREGARVVKLNNIIRFVKRTSIPNAFC